MAIIYSRANYALNTNPPAGSERLTVHGSDWLWAVAVIFIISTIILFALSHFARSGEKFFHYLFTIASFVGAVAYFAMASDLGWSVIATSTGTGGPSRQIFFAKYVYWVVSFPTVVIALGIVSGVSWTTIVYEVFLSWAWVISYLVGAYTATSYKWGFYAFGTVAYFFLIAAVLGGGLAGARRVGITRDFILLAGWTSFLWLLYTIAYGLSDGGNRIGVTAGFIFFGILDLLFLPVLSYAFLILSRSWDYSRLNIAFTQYGRIPVSGTRFAEKEPGDAPVTGGTEGVA